MLLRVLCLQTWERFQVIEHGMINPIKRAAFMYEIGLTPSDAADLLKRYGWIFLSHHGERG